MEIFRKRDMKRKLCKQCGKNFVMKTYNQVFCGQTCRNNFFNDMKAEAMSEYRSSRKKEGTND